MNLKQSMATLLTVGATIGAISQEKIKENGSIDFFNISPKIEQVISNFSTTPSTLNKQTISPFIFEKENTLTGNLESDITNIPQAKNNFVSITDGFNKRLQEIADKVSLATTAEFKYSNNILNRPVIK